MKIRHLATVAISALALTTACQSAQAAGFYIQEQSVKGLGTAFAGSTTSIDDASTIYFNPAGMTKLDGAQINAGVHVLIPNADLTDTGSTFDPDGIGAAPAVAVGGNDGGNPYDPTPVPNLYAAMPFDISGQEVWAGIGVSAPFGLGSDYGDDWFGRFDSTETELMTINVQPSVAFKPVEWMSLGGGVDIQYADAELSSRLFAGSVGESKLKGDDISFGYNLGAQFYPTEKTEIGLHYRSAISHELDGRISVTGSGAADFDISGTADLDLPDIATFGVAHDVNNRLRIMGQATWFGWENFDEIRAKNDAGGTVSVVTQDYDDTWAFAIGAEYDLNEDWTVRAGYQFDETPTNDQFRTSRTPDGDRNWFSGGATYKFSDKVDLDFAATYIDVDEGTINVSRNDLGFGAGPRAQVNANTDGYVGIVAVGLNYKF